MNTLRRFIAGICSVILLFLYHPGFSRDLPGEMRTIVLFPIIADSAMLNQLENPVLYIRSEVSKGAKYGITFTGEQDPFHAIQTASPTMEEIVAYGDRAAADLVMVVRFEGLRSRVFFEIRVFDVHQKEQVFIEDTPEFTDPEHWQTVFDAILDDFLNSVSSPPGFLLVNTVPEGSRIDIDGNATGIAPLTLQLPGNREYTIKASRIGYYSHKRTIRVTPSDTLELTLKLQRVSRKKASSASIRLMLSAGWPYNQTSSTLDSRISIGNGRTLGASLSIGEKWRLSFGYYNYENRNESISREDWIAYGAKETPLTRASVYYSGLHYSVGRRDVHGILGVGLAGMHQTIKVDLEIPSNPPREDQRETVIEVGWILQAGIEFNLGDHFITQLEMLHAQNFATRSTWKDPKEIVDPFWESAFHAFRDFTVVRFTLGYRL